MVPKSRKTPQQRRAAIMSHRERLNRYVQILATPMDLLNPIPLSDILGFVAVYACCEVNAERQLMLSRFYCFLLVVGLQNVHILTEIYVGPIN